MNIELELAFSFKRDLDDAYRALELPAGATVLDALREFVRRYPGVREKVFDDSGLVLRSINALVNGSNVILRAGFDTKLVPGDRLTILPPVGGG